EHQADGERHGVEEPAREVRVANQIAEVLEGRRHVEPERHQVHPVEVCVFLERGDRHPVDGEDRDDDEGRQPQVDQQKPPDPAAGSASLGGGRAQGVAGATSTKHELNGAAPAGDARSGVSTFAQPRVSAPEASGVNHAPSLMETTPGAMRSVTRAGSRVTPRPLKTRTISPSATPRAAASATLIQTSSTSARARTGWLPWIECVRARDLGVTRRRGWGGATGSSLQVR